MIFAYQLTNDLCISRGGGGGSGFYSIVSNKLNADNRKREGCLKPCNKIGNPLSYSMNSLSQ